MTQKIPFDEAVESLKNNYLIYSAKNSELIEYFQDSYNDYYENSACKDISERVLDYGIQINDFQSKIEESKNEYYGEEQNKLSLDQETCEIALLSLRGENLAFKKENEELKIKLKKTTEMVTQLQKENDELKIDLHESHEINEKLKGFSSQNHNELAPSPNKYAKGLVETNMQLEENIKNLKRIILKYESEKTNLEDTITKNTQLEENIKNLNDIILQKEYTIKSLQDNIKNLNQKIKNIEMYNNNHQNHSENIFESKESQNKTKNKNNKEINQLKEFIQNLQKEVSELKEEKEDLTAQLHTKNQKEEEETKMKEEQSKSSDEDSSENAGLIKELRKKLCEYEEELRAKMKDKAIIGDLQNENEKLQKKLLIAEKKEKDLLVFFENEKKKMNKGTGIIENKTESKMQELNERLAAFQKENENLKAKNNEIANKLEETDHKLKKYKRKYERMKINSLETSKEGFSVPLQTKPKKK